MQLGQLANLERQRILDEYEEIKKRVAYLEDLLANPRKITYLVRDELADLKKKFGDPRRTEIVTDFAGEISDEDLVANEKVLITISGRGYVKRMPATTYRAQRRGGRGIIGQVLREEDALRHMVAANARDNILFFTDKGKVYPAQGVAGAELRPHGARHAADQRDQHRAGRERHGDPGRAGLREQRLPDLCHAAVAR